MTDSPQPRSFLISLAVVLVVVLALNVILSVYAWAPTLRLWRGAVAIPETLILVWVCLAASNATARGGRRLAVLAVGAAFGLLLCFSVAEAFFQSYFSRPFYPRSDIPLVRGGLLLLFGDIGRIADILTPVVIVFILAVGATAGAVLMTGAAAVLRRAHRPGVSLAVISVIAVSIMVAAGLPRSLAALSVSWMRPTPAEFVTVDRPEIAEAGLDGEQKPAEVYRLPGLLDRDIYFFAIEAYGYTTVSRPDLADQFDPILRQFQDALAAAGYAVATSYFRSPVAGGYSWLAEATLLTGQWVDSQEKFQNLYGAGLPSVSSLLHEAGYYTLTVRPGTIHGDWPEGWDLYRFDEAITSYNKDFGFVGPWFSFVPVTDQFALWTGSTRISQLTRPGGDAADRPLLAYFQLVSTHTPFNRIPPIIEDWNELGDGSIYSRRAAEIMRFDNTWTGGTQLDEGYIAAFGYEFEILSDFVTRIMDHSRSPILILLGDHQPQKPIRTRDAVLSVPVHVATRDESVMALFEANGFERGMVGSQPPPHRGLDTFFPMFSDIAFAPGGD